MSNKQRSNLLVASGMVCLMLAGCGGGGDDTTISDPAQAKSAAAAIDAVFKGFYPVRYFNPSFYGATALAADFQTPALHEASPLAGFRQPSLMKRLALPDKANETPIIVACRDGGSYTSTESTSANGSFRYESIYDQCRANGEIWNGRELRSSEVNADGTNVRYTTTFGDGDQILEAGDLVVNIAGTTITWTGTETYSMQFTSGTLEDLRSQRSCTANEIGSVHFRRRDEHAGVTEMYVTAVDSNGTLVQLGNGTTVVNSSTYKLAGSWSASREGDGQTFEFTLVTDKVSGTQTYDYATHELNLTFGGTLSFKMMPSTCFGGTFTVETATPFKSVHQDTLAGEFNINGNTSVAYSTPDIIAINHDGTEVFRGARNQLTSDVTDACPMYDEGISFSW